MADRVTTEHLYSRIKYINNLLGLRKKYVKSKAEYTGNEIELSGAYGGWQLRMTNGSTLTSGFSTKREIMTVLEGMEKGIVMYKKRATLKK